MPRDGSGTMSRVHDWTTDASASIDITASRVDADTDDIATELTNSVAVDGQSTMTGNLKMGNQRVTGAGDGTALTDLATVKQVQDRAMGYAVATGSANAYVITLSPAPTAYVAGQRFTFKANFTNTGSATLNVNGLGAKTIGRFGTLTLNAGDIVSSDVVEVVYDGDNFEIPVPSMRLSRDSIPALGGDLSANGNDINMADNVISRPELKDYAETNTVANTSTAYTIDLTNGNVFELTLTGNCTFTFSNPPASGKGGSFTLILKQDGTGSRTTTWPASVDWEDSTAPTLTTAANAVDVLAFITTDGGTTWYGFTAGVNFG